MRSGLRVFVLAAAAVVLVTAAHVTVMGRSAVVQAAGEDQPQPSPYGPVYEIGKDVSPPAVVYAPEAKFPKSVEKKKNKKKIKGVVVVRLIVDKEGTPQDIHVIRSFREDFDAEAVKAVKQYRFKPAMRFQEPVAVFIVVEVNFARY